MHTRAKDVFSGGNSWGGDYDNGYQTGYGGGASAGPMRNSYVSERSAPYSRDYGGMKLKTFSNIDTNIIKR